MSEENRRPIKARSLKVFQSLAVLLAHSKVTPNQISVASVLFSLLVPIGSFLFPLGSWAVAVFAVAGIQLRLICNLLDGMVAIEGAKKTVLGDIYNEFPDRIADTIIIVGFSLPAYGDIRVVGFSWAAAFFSILTAYTRVLGASTGARHYFIGPMAKQHRMAYITLSSIAIPIVNWIAPEKIILGVLGTICVGCVVCVMKRLSKISEDLHSH